MIQRIPSIKRETAFHGRHSGVNLCKMFLQHKSKKKKRTATPVSDCRGRYGCEMLKIPHCLDNWLADGGEAVKPYAPAVLLSSEIFFSVSGTHFC
jgi:hypothetical protein